MPRASKYASEEERLEARKARQREYVKAKRAKQAEEEGREQRAVYETSEEREEGRKRNVRRAVKKHKAKTPKTPWEPRFCGIDGESFALPGEFLPDGSPKQAYCLLLRNDKEAIFDPEGLSTWACLDYLTKDPPRKTALVGYFLNFDFEWILKDITTPDYKKLQDGETVSICADYFRLQWFKGKKLVVYRAKDSARWKEPHLRKLNKDFLMVTFQDVSGFFQSSFVSALEKWGFAKDDRLQTIKDGKAARGAFELENLESVAYYNKMEMELLEELMQQVYLAFKAAYDSTELQYKVHSGTWSGPGTFASDFLSQTLWGEEHGLPREEQREYFKERYKDYFGNDAAKDFPFSQAYFGGRIELGAVGRFRQAVWNYDINSAYPYAVSLLPRWSEEDFKLYELHEHALSEGGKEFLSRRLMGMYRVRFEFPEGWSWYPFPVRMVNKGAANVYYPPHGVTNVMSAELFAALDTLPEEELSKITIVYAYVLDNSDGYGDALNRMPEDRLCLTAKKVSKMAAFRLECKDAAKRVGTPEEQERDAFLAMAEKGLKLILNSLYGKTVQQVGSHKHYNDFASAWITSVCRALLWRALAPERKTHSVLMTMTDGIYSTKPLPFAHERLTSVLGDWEKEEFTYFEAFKPGIYRYEKKGKMNYKVRGFLTPTTEAKEELFALIWESVSRGTKGSFASQMFIPRTMALHKKWVRYPYLRQFYKDSKVIESELKAKRAPNPGTLWLIPEGEENTFFEPKRGYGFNESQGYALDFEGERLKVSNEDELDAWGEYYDSVIGFEDFYETGANAS